jgi:membrane fusion protein (multidrug efflux system)
MKKIIIIMIAIAFLVLVGFKVRQKLVLSQTLVNQTTQQKNKPNSSIPAVKVMIVTPQSIKESLKLVGNIEVETEIAIQPRINGRLVSLLVEEGQPLSVGSLIGIMDDEAIRIQLQQSEANNASLNANVQQAEININKYKTEKERYQELLNKRYISQRDYENVENSYLTSQASLDGLKAQLQAAQKNYELLKLQLNQTKIYSPINGYVLKKLVTPGVNLTTGTTIITAAALDPVKLTFTIDQKDTAKITKGIRVNFGTDAYPDQIFQGYIDQMAPTYDPKTRTLRLSAAISNPLHKLIPGMFGTTEIIIGGNQQALVVPQEAVITQENRTGIFIVGGDNIAHFHEVKLGLVSEGKVEIIDGVKNGDLAVIIGQNRLRDGQQVQLLGGGGDMRQRSDQSDKNQRLKFMKKSGKEKAGVTR